MTDKTLGGLIKTVRQQKNWTLRQMSQIVGVPLSTLAKVEADKLSLTYDKLQQFTSKLGMTLAEFMAQNETSATALPSAAPAIITARRSLTANGASVRVSTPNYDYEYLCADLREKRMVPIITRIRAQTIGDFGDPVRHRGEEFVYVLEGAVEVHLQFYRPVVLQTGEGLYVDSTMGHAYIAKDCETALILAVCSSEDVDLAEELISQAEGEASNQA
jgi:transcriptional regulator with XRE-family HTH domain